jgi:hypothetical protein
MIRARPEPFLPGRLLGRSRVQAHRDILQRRRWRRIAAHDQRVVAGHDMTVRICQTLDLAERIEHRCYIQCGYKRAIGFKVFVKMTRVRRQHHVAAPGANPHGLKTSGMAGRQMQVTPGESSASPS